MLISIVLLVVFVNGIQTRLHAGETPPGIKRQSVYQTTYKTTDDQKHVGPSSVNPGLEVPGHTLGQRQVIGNNSLVPPGQRDICAAPYGPETAFFCLVVVDASVGRGIANAVLVDQMAGIRVVSWRGNMHSDETMTDPRVWIR